MKYTLTIVAILTFFIIRGDARAVSANGSFNPYVKEGIRQYRQLVEYNQKNTRAECADNNWYIFSFNPDDNWLELSHNGLDTDGNTLYSPQKLEAINDLLVTFNQNETTQLYICLVTDWKVGLQPYHPEKLIRNTDPSVKTKDLLLEFSSDEKRAFRDSIQLRFSAILSAILNNSHQDSEHSLFSQDNRVVWGLSEFRAKFFLGQDKLSGGVIEGWSSNPADLEAITNKTELFDYIRFVKDHRHYNELNSRESKVRHHVEGFTEYLSGAVDHRYVPLADQLQFESFHYIPWETIPEDLKSQDGGQSFDAAVAVASAEIQLKKAENLSVDFLADAESYKFVINEATTNFNELSRKKLRQLDDKCAYLKHKTGLEFYIYFKQVDFLMQPVEYNVFANRILVESGLSTHEEGAVLLCFPYFMPGADVLNVNGINLTEQPSVMPGIAFTNGDMATAFFTEVNDILSEGGILWDFMKLAFKHTPKPHRVHGATLMLGNFREENFAARIFIEEMTSPEQPELVTGYFNMNDLFLYKDKRIQELRELEGQKLSTCISEVELSESTYTLCDDLAEQIEAIFQSPPNGFDVVNYEFQIKEKYLDPELPDFWQSGEYLAKYAALEIKNETAFLDKWTIEFNDLENDGVVYNIGFFDLAYDPLDAASLIPGIGEVADGAILLVGLSEVLFGEDTERGMMAVAGSGLGLFLIGDNYVEVPLRQGKKLFIGPGIGFVTKDAIAQGTDPVRVQKIFGLADAGPGSTAVSLVNNTVGDGRRLHRVILDNDKLFDHLRVMPKVERHAFLLEMANNPNLLESVFDNAAITMKPVDLWRMVHKLEPVAKEAIQALADADKVTFYQHLELYGNSFYAFIGNHSEDIDAVGAWMAFRDNLTALGVNETGLLKAQNLLTDLDQEVTLIHQFRDRPTFVVAWDVLYGQGEDVLIPLRKSENNLDIVDEYLFEYPERLETVQIDYILANEKQPYVDALLGPGVPGDFVTHRVRGLYDNIFPEDDLNVLTDGPYGNYGIITHVEPEVAGNDGLFVRQYIPEENLIIFNMAFLREAPEWLDNGKIPLIEGEGIRTSMYVTLRQMRLLNIPDGSLTKGKMSTIQNQKTMMWVTREMEEKGYDEISMIGNDILNCPHINYVVNSLKQAGYRVKNATVNYVNFPVKISAQGAHEEFEGEITEALLDHYGFDWNSLLYYNFNINFELETF